MVNRSARGEREEESGSEETNWEELAKAGASRS